MILFYSRYKEKSNELYSKPTNIGKNDISLFTYMFPFYILNIAEMKKTIQKCMKNECKYIKETKMKVLSLKPNSSRKNILRKNRKP